MKFLAIDFGKKRIGLALGEVIPYGAGFVDGQNIDEASDKIGQLCQDNEVGSIVVGLPIRSQGEMGTLVPQIKSFAEKLFVKTTLPIFFEPEQFTSSEAEAELLQKTKSRPEAGKIDELAAILILERFLERPDQEKKLPDIGQLKD